MAEEAIVHEAPRRRVKMKMEMQRFRLPPVESALVIGRRAPIGPTAMDKALQEMVPHEFVRVDVEHPTIQTILIHEAHLRRVPKDTLIPMLLSHAEGVLDESEMLHVSLDISISVAEEFDL